ncbi:unnamed protein product, partial [Brassica rapa subsp. trilocularis]
QYLVKLTTSSQRGINPFDIFIAIFSIIKSREELNQKPRGRSDTWLLFNCTSWRRLSQPRTSVYVSVQALFQVLRICSLTPITATAPPPLSIFVNLRRGSTGSQLLHVSVVLCSGESRRRRVKPRHRRNRQDLQLREARELQW